MKLLPKPIISPSPCCLVRNIFVPYVNYTSMRLRDQIYLD